MEKLQQCCRLVREGRWKMNGMMKYSHKTQVGLVEAIERERCMVNLDI